MKRIIGQPKGLLVALVLPALLLTVPDSATAQRRAGGSGGGNGGARSTPSGGGRAVAAPNRIPSGGGGARVGVAVPRTGSPYRTVVVVPRSSYGFYPWGFGGIGLGFYGSYIGGYYDPWFGYASYGYPGMYPWPYASPRYGYGYGYGGRYDDSGSIKLKVEPHDASVYVDGYYAGVVDDFDGALQHLDVQPGPHHLEIKAPGYETLTVDVQVQPGRTLTYRSDMRRTQP